MNILQWANEHGDASKTYYMLKTKIIINFSVLVRANDLIKTCGKNLLWCSKRKNYGRSKRERWTNVKIMNLQWFNNEDMLLTNFELTWTSYQVPKFTHHYLSSGDCHNSGITEFTILNNIFDHSQCNKVFHCLFFCFLDYE